LVLNKKGEPLLHACLEKVSARTKVRAEREKRKVEIKKVVESKRREIPLDPRLERNLLKGVGRVLHASVR